MSLWWDQSLLVQGRLIAGPGAEKGVAKIDHQKIAAPPEKDHQGYKVQVDEGSYIIAEICHQKPSEVGRITNIPMVQ